MEGTVIMFLYFSMIFEKVSLDILTMKVKKISQLGRIETDCINISQEGGFN